LGAFSQTHPVTLLQNLPKKVPSSLGPKSKTGRKDSGEDAAGVVCPKLTHHVERPKGGTDAEKNFSEDEARCVRVSISKMFSLKTLPIYAKI
jgi:hypothetical protein